MKCSEVELRNLALHLAAVHGYIVKPTSGDLREIHSDLIEAETVVKRVSK